MTVASINRAWSRQLNRGVFDRIDKLALYAVTLIKSADIPVTISRDRLGWAYHRTCMHKVATHNVVDGILVVRLE